MVEFQVPEILNNYLLFCNYREECQKSKILNLRDCKWIYPTTLIPLGIFIKENKTKFEYKAPLDHNVSNYISLVTGELKIEYSEDKSYIPLVALPKDQNQSSNVLECIFRLHHNGDEYGGENAFKYLIEELVDNIYQHSNFTNALVMAQKYEKKNFVEICFFDDGISIPGSFEKRGLKFEDQEAIAEAVNGFSTKSQERGRGLNSNLRMFTQELNGEVLIVSRSGALFVSKKLQKLYKLRDIHKLKGTLISIRIPYPAPKIDIYQGGYL